MIKQTGDQWRNSIQNDDLLNMSYVEQMLEHYEDMQIQNELQKYNNSDNGDTENSRLLKMDKHIFNMSKRTEDLEEFKD